MYKQFNLKLSFQKKLLKIAPAPQLDPIFKFDVLSGQLNKLYVFF